MILGNDNLSREKLVRGIVTALPFNQTATEFQICQYVPLGRSQGPGRVQRAHGGAQTRTSGSFSVVMMIILSIIQQLWNWDLDLGGFWVRCGIVARCSRVAPGVVFVFHWAS